MLRSVIIFPGLCLHSQYFLKRSSDAGVDMEMEIVQRAVRSVPGSGEVCARYMRLLVSCFCRA